MAGMGEIFLDIDRVIAEMARASLRARLRDSDISLRL
jgi:hypothetical protein